MNKPLLLLTAAFLAVSPVAMFAQNAQNAQIPQPGLGSPAIVEPAQSPELKRFNLDFPGGTPGALAAAISKAMGKHLNIIIPSSHADTKIMPIKVEGVTVQQLFTAIGAASRRSVPVISGQGGQRSIQFKGIEILFLTTSKPVTDESVWSFLSTAPSAEDAAVLSLSEEPEQVCQYFQLAQYLQDHTVEDITTAIQTGWKMLKVKPVPQLSFHEETKLLIAVGAAQHVGQIPQVLQQLPLDNSTAVEKIAKWQAELADIEMKKAGDWEKKAQEKREQIDRLAALQKAREAIQNSPGSSRRPVPRVIP